MYKLSLKFFPEERAAISDRLISEEINDQEYFKLLDDLEEEAKRQKIRNDFETVLSGGTPETEEAIHPDPDLDARMDAIIAHKFGIKK